MWIASALGAALVSSSSWAITVEVAPTGVDGAGCGDPATPCATLAFALGEVTGAGDTVHLSNGTYLLTDPVVVTKSGASGNRLVIDGSGAGTVLNGALLVGNPVGVTVLGDYVTLRDLAITGTGGSPLRIEAAETRVINAQLSLPASNNRACVEIDGAQGTVLRASTVEGCTAEGIAVTNSADVVVRTTSVRGAAGAAILAQDVSDLTIEGVDLAGNGTGMSSAAIELERCAGFRIGGYPGTLPGSILGHPGPAISILDSSDGQLRNTIISGVVGGVVISQGGATTDLVLDVFYLTVAETGAAPVFTDGASGTSLFVRNSVFAFNPAGDLMVASATHHHNLRHQNGAGGLALVPTEIDADPLFADAAADDYHLMSAHGRYQAGAWTNDVSTSPAIDLGDPADSYARETPLNGDRANAGAYGNTEQASRSASGTIPDAGVAPDSSVPDSSAPDYSPPDYAAPDAALPDLSSEDAGLEDVEGSDLAVEMDAAQVDVHRADANASQDITIRDREAQDTVTSDIATLDTGGGDDQVALDSNIGADNGDAIVVARAGRDQSAEVPSIITLDGSDSTAPANAAFVWTISDSPAGPGSEPLGTDPVARAAIDAEGIWVFQLTITAGGVSDSDLIEVRALDTEQAVAEGCGCAMHGSPGLLWSSLMVALGALRHRRRRGLASSTSHARPRSGASS